MTSPLEILQFSCDWLAYLRLYVMHGSLSRIFSKIGGVHLRVSSTRVTLRAVRLSLMSCVGALHCQAHCVYLLPGPVVLLSDASARGSLVLPLLFGTRTTNFIRLFWFIALPSPIFYSVVQVSGFNFADGIIIDFFYDI